ncbi:MAG: hypothetical protein GQE15_26930 [Archangiaceae bacterium]|nr:hypothetical protein [Archangiaceae bacterium]
MFRARFGVLALLVFAACPAPQPVTDAGLDPDAGVIVPDAGSGAGDAGFEWPVPISPITITPHASWKNRITIPFDPFAQDSAEVLWVKFTVLMRDPTKVYFQDGRTYPLHAPFAVARLDPFVGMTVPQFDAVSLHAAGQQAITGAVLTNANFNEVGIQLVRADPYPKEMVKRVFDLVKSSLDAQPGLQAFYMPTFEQQASAERDRAWLATNGIPLSTPDRWTRGSVCYAMGWALGKLVHVAPGDLDAAYADGRLTVNDVLVTERIPAEVPPVAGIVSLTAATPNSHVAILATTLDIPFVFTPHEADVTKLAALDGKQVMVRVSTATGSCTFDVFDATGLAPTVRTQLLNTKQPPALNLPAKQTRGAYSASTDALQVADARFFGGKAANYGLLRRALPNDSYPAVALSFDAWDDAMAQQVSTGRTLRAELDQRLAPISTWPPQNLAVTRATLAQVRAFIEAEATFSSAAQAGIRAALTGFDPTKGIRFRSSTNVEDTAQFTGAGLYDSFTGCLADDDDQDTVGPSRCTPGKKDERGVFLALRRVFASFYNDNAYLERLRHRVNESQVGMAVLVHASVPDDEELANGVATYVWSGPTSKTLDVVTQLGADSVTNPTGESTPEVLRGWSYAANSWTFFLERPSSRIPLGRWVMDEQGADNDYKKLGVLLDRVAAAHAPTVTAPFALDFEFKKQVPLPGKLWVKQVRPLPVPSTANTVVPFVLNRPRRLCTFQGENSNLLSIHRTRLRLDAQLRDVLLTDAERLQSLLGSPTLELVDGDSVQTISGAPSGWPGFAHSQDMNTLLDAFSFGNGARARTVQLSVEVPRLVNATQPPIITAQELLFWVHVTWAQPQLAIPQFPGAPTTTLQDDVVLQTCPEDEVITSRHSLQTRTFDKGGISVTTKFYWPPNPSGPSAGYTAPNVKWVGTDITGLTTQPLRLTADFAQTYRPQHHNFTEDFLFDPFRDPATTAAQKSELMARDVKWLIVSTDSGQPFRAVKFDGTLSTLP